MEMLGYMAVIFIGLVLGMIGAGGSMLAIPVLVYFFSMDMETASAYSLFVIGTTSLSGLLLRGKQETISLTPVVLLAIPSVAGVFVSRNWVISCAPDVIWRSDAFVLTKDDVLLALFAFLMLASSITIFLKKERPVNETVAGSLYRLVPIGFGIGIITGLTGAGGGFLILPALVVIAGLPFSTAVSASLLIIAMNSLLGFCGDLFNRSIDWIFLVCLTALAIAGLLLGYWSQRRIKINFSARRVFAWLMILIGTCLLARIGAG